MHEGLSDAAYVALIKCIKDCIDADWEAWELVQAWEAVDHDDES